MRTLALGLALAAVVGASGCATHPKRLASCAGDPGTQGTPFTLQDRQNFALGRAVEEHFGKQRVGYHKLVRQPRPSALDAAGNPVFELFDIYPDSGGGAVPTAPRKLTIVLDRCTLAVRQAVEPAA